MGYVYYYQIKEKQWLWKQRSAAYEERYFFVCPILINQLTINSVSYEIVFVKMKNTKRIKNKHISLKNVKSHYNCIKNQFYTVWFNTVIA